MKNPAHMMVFDDHYTAKRRKSLSRLSRPPAPTKGTKAPPKHQALRRYLPVIEDYVSERWGRLYMSEETPSDWQVDAVKHVASILPKKAQAALRAARDLDLPAMLALTGDMQDKGKINDAESVAMFLWLATQVLPAPKEQ